MLVRPQEASRMINHCGTAAKTRNKHFRDKIKWSVFQDVLLSPSHQNIPYTVCSRMSLLLKTGLFFSSHKKNNQKENAQLDQVNSVQ